MIAYISSDYNEINKQTNKKTITRDTTENIQTHGE
jgi:hypothetical protein